MALAIAGLEPGNDRRVAFGKASAIPRSWRG